MYKTLSSKNVLKHNDLFSLAAELTALSLIVAWAIELLARELLRLG